MVCVSESLLVLKEIFLNLNEFLLDELLLDLNEFWHSFNEFLRNPEPPEACPEVAADLSPNDNEPLLDLDEFLSGLNVLWHGFNQFLCVPSQNLQKWR
mmetsp:Transcript_1957/g.2342  ORF Transcript_1957/g.2342 Transcript_1957/m.2342 type:complete len:98 (-) Transcript_1957:604-897(-)